MFSLLVVILLRIAKMYGVSSSLPTLPLVPNFEQTAAASAVPEHLPGGVISWSNFSPQEQQEYDFLRKIAEEDSETARKKDIILLKAKQECDLLTAQAEAELMVKQCQKQLAIEKELRDLELEFQRKQAIAEIENAYELRQIELDEFLAKSKKQVAERRASISIAAAQCVPKSNPSQRVSVPAKKSEFPPPKEEIAALKKQLATLGKSVEDKVMRDSINTRIEELDRQVLEAERAELTRAMREFCSENPGFQRKKDLIEIVHSFEREIEKVSTKLNAFKRPPMPSPAKPSARASAGDVSKLVAELNQLECDFHPQQCPAERAAAERWLLAQKRIKEIISILTN